MTATQPSLQSADFAREQAHAETRHDSIDRSGASAQTDSDLSGVTRIVLRPIGSPLPIGLFIVVIGSSMVSALQWGILSGADRKSVALIMFPAFVIQLIAAIVAFLDRDSGSGTLMMTFAGLWLVIGLVFYLSPPGASETFGIFLILISVLVMLMLPVALPKRALAAVAAVAVPRFLLSGIAAATNSVTIGQVAALLGFFLAAVALYGAFALLLEEARGREILPTGRSGPAAKAMHGDLALQTRNIEDQAGVRRTL